MAGKQRMVGGGAAPRRAPRPRRGQTEATKSTLPNLDPLVHARARLGILSALAVNDALSFNELKQLLDVTDGNLSVHARKLEDAGYVSCLKSFQGRAPRTDFRLTAAGRRALERYLDRMEQFIKTVR